MNSSRRIFQVHCPSCLTEFPIDSAKLPEKGVAAICSVCLRVFPVFHPRSDGHYVGVDDLLPGAASASAVEVEEELIDLEIEIPQTEGEIEMEDPDLEEFEVISEWPGDDGLLVTIDDDSTPVPSPDEAGTVAGLDSEVPESPPGIEELEVASEIDDTEPDESADQPTELIEDSFSEVFEGSTEGPGSSSGDIATVPDLDGPAPEVPDGVAQESEPEFDAAEVLEEAQPSVDAAEVREVESVSVETEEVVAEDATEEVVSESVVEEIASEYVIEEVEAEVRSEEGSPEVVVEPEPEVVDASEPPQPPTPAAPERPVFEDLSSFTNEVLAEAESTFPPPIEKVRPAPEKVERFGRRDPHERARHLARVLVSDIIAYYPVRYQESLARRTLPEDFADEIQKSYREYVDQVGSEMAESTPYFVDALNHVLGRGEKFF